MTKRHEPDRTAEPRSAALLPHALGLSRTQILTSAALCVWSVLATCPALADSEPTKLAPIGGLVLTLAPGDPVQTDLGYGIVVNGDSSLVRIAAVVNDQRAPVQLQPWSTVATRFVRDGSRGDFGFRAKARMNMRETLAAVEVRFLLLDVFGGHMKTLSATIVRDLAGGTFMDLGPERATTTERATWRAGEHDVAEYGISIAWIAKARRADGSVWEMDHNELLEKVFEVKKGLKLEHLAPEEREP